MKINPIMLFGVFLIGISSLEAQEKTSLTLDDAVRIAWEKSDEVTLANTKVNTKKYELRSTKNNQYPDLKASGQYQRLAGADVNLKMNHIKEWTINMANQKSDQHRQQESDQDRQNKLQDQQFEQNQQDQQQQQNHQYQHHIPNQQRQQNVKDQKDIQRQKDQQN